MRHSIGLLVLIAALTAAAAEAPPSVEQVEADAPASVQIKPAAAPEPKTPPAPSKSKDAEPTQAAGKDTSPDEFKPSENVSEDAAVPYPVDI